MTLKDHQLEKLTQLPPRRPGATGDELLRNRRRTEMLAALVSLKQAKETTEATLKSVRG